MFIIDLRNKLVSEYRCSVINNSNVDELHIYSHFTQYANYSIYLKVRSAGGDYVDKIAIASENIAIQDDALVVKWLMGAVSTQCKKIEIQLQFEQGETIVAQSRIVSVILGDTIDVSKEITPIYPDVLKHLQAQIDTLKAESYAVSSISYANDVLTILMKNKDKETLTSLQVSIPTSASFVSASLSGNVITFTDRSGNTHDIDLTNLLNAKVDKTNEHNKVYGTNNSGEQIVVNVDYGSNFGGNVVRRDSNSQIYVPLTPTANGHSTSKGYVDGFGYGFELSIDSSTYVVSLKLKDKNNNQIGETQTIDLPLETMVVSGSYDDTTKSLILTLKNGQTITIPISDLISGLVSTSSLIASNQDIQDIIYGEGE